MPGKCREGVRFRSRKKQPLIITMGEAAVISCDGDSVAWMEEQAGRLRRDEVFDAAFIAKLQSFVERDRLTVTGPSLKYVCSPFTFRPATCGEVKLSIVGKEAIAAILEELQGHGLHARDELAAVARAGERIVGVAGASADSETLWQIGVEVAEDCRGKGIGTALVSALTEQVLQRGKIPYYSTAASNLHSGAIALKLGYWPAWTEMYAR
jgi:GNAT superfamily N-acetyltransferase